MSLSGKIAIVTGGASGIGFATTNLFLQSGAKVAVFDVQGSVDLFKSDDVIFVKTDISSEESVNSAYAEVISKWGRVDVLVNNAGVMDEFSRASDVTNAVWNRCLAVNVTGPFFLIRLAVATFLSQKIKGSIVNVCSTSAIRGASAGPAYTASKHALLGLSRSTAWAYSKDGIRCNVVHPGGVETPIMKNVKVDEAGRAFLLPYLNTMPDYCQPGDLAAAILFLATATAVNGAELTVDHGWTTA